MSLTHKIIIAVVAVALIVAASIGIAKTISGTPNGSEGVVTVQ